MSTQTHRLDSLRRLLFAWGGIVSWVIMVAATTATSPPSAVVSSPASARVVVVTMTAIGVATALWFAILSLAIGVGNVVWSARDRAWDGLWRLVHIELAVNVLGNRLDFCAKFLFNLVQVESILPVDQVDGQTEVSETARSPDPMQICLSVFGEVKIDDDIHGLNIDTPSQQVGADKVAADTISEVVEDAISMVLLHASMGVKARVSQLSDLLGQ